MKPSISQVCSLKSDFRRDLEDYSSAACETLELYLTKLEDFLENETVESARDLLLEYSLTAPVASFQGGLLSSQGEARQQHWNHFAKRLEICQALGVNTLVVAADIREQLTQQDLERVVMSLGQAARQAAQYNLRIALEFQAKSTFLNNLQTAVATLAQVGEPNLGICLDVFHYYIGPSKFEDLGLLSPENLFHVQLCDIAARPREFAEDRDRILPGDGDFLLEPLLEQLKAIGYQGCVSLELMNPTLWQVPPQQIGEVGITALRKLLGVASMGVQDRST